MSRTFTFVQYFEVLGADKLKIDKIDKTLGCVWLSWHRTSGKPGNLSPGRECRLVLIVSFRGTINLATKNTMLSVIDKSEACVVIQFHFYKGDDVWKNQFFLRKSILQQKY